MRLRDAIDQLRPLQMVIGSMDGEYRVNFRFGKEETAYYTTDLEDAVATGKAMRAQRPVKNQAFPK